MMRHALLCMLGIFLLKTLLHCGHAEIPDAVLTIEPNWSTLFTGESVTLTCDIRQGKKTDWSYTFSKNGQKVCSNSTKKSCPLKLMKNHSEYQCTGRQRSGNLTAESRPVTVNVSNNNRPNLTASPLWLIPAASVTLNCSVKDPTAGWRFYWYKAVPNPTANSYNNYSYELLPGSHGGTEQGSYIIHGQTHTAGYVCRAGRGDPVFYTFYSKPKFVWSGDFHPVSIKVTPDSEQHFFSDDISLSCKGNSANLRLMKFSEGGYLSNCSAWGTVTGSTCNIHQPKNKTAVYWCESGTGQFSNAVNITVQNSNIILVSPVQPVTEGHSLTLGCKLRTETFVSNVLFYRNKVLIQNDTRGELTISAVSKSHEGLYKCEHSGKASKQSWVAVKLSRHEPSSVLLPVIIGLFCGISVIALLLLLCRYRKSKNLHFARTTQAQKSDRDSALCRVVHQDETHTEVHLTHLDDADESSDVTYSLVQFKKMKNTGKCAEPRESYIYSNVMIQSPAEKSSPAATDATIYSEIKPGAGLGP